MNMPELSERVESLLMMVYELQKIIDVMPYDNPQLVDAMSRLKLAAKQLDEAMPEL